MKFHISLSSMLVNTDGYLIEQHVPRQPCKTPRAILLVWSSKGAPKENKSFYSSGYDKGYNMFIVFTRK